MIDFLSFFSYSTTILPVVYYLVVYYLKVNSDVFCFVDSVKNLVKPVNALSDPEKYLLENCPLPEDTGNEEGAKLINDGGQKQLPQRIGYEVWLRPRYAIARFMNCKIAFRTEDNQPMILTVKPISEKNVGDQIQLHLRFKGKDYWNNISDVLDVDVYIPIEEWKKVVRLMG